MRAQVEAVLLAHPAVVQAAAFGIENSVMGEMVHAAVTLSPTSQVSSQCFRWFKLHINLHVVGHSTPRNLCCYSVSPVSILDSHWKSTME